MVKHHSLMDSRKFHITLLYSINHLTLETKCLMQNQEKKTQMFQHTCVGIFWIVPGYRMNKLWNFKVM